MPFRRRILYIIYVGIVLSSYYLIPLYLSHSNIWFKCPFRTIYGFKCPACGTTEATLLLLKMQFEEALCINPLSLVTNFLIIASTLWIITDIIRNKETLLPALIKPFPLKITIAIILLVIINWIYVVNI